MGIFAKLKERLCGARPDAPPPGGYSVRILDMAHYMDPEEGERVVDGFATLEEAREYARNRVRASVEELREPGQSPEELHRLWTLYGEDALVIGGDYAGSRELKKWLHNPQTAMQSADSPEESPAPAQSYSVRILDMAHYMDPEEGERVVDGFATLEEAEAYARNRVRASVEELREPGQSPEKLRQLWHLYGEDALVIGGDYAGSHDLEEFVRGG